jgi:type IV secretory pathway VirB6-like protein
MKILMNSDTTPSTENGFNGNSTTSQWTRAAKYILIVLKTLFVSYILTGIQRIILYLAVLFGKATSTPSSSAMKSPKTMKVRIYFHNKLQRFYPQYKTMGKWENFKEMLPGYFIWKVPYDVQFITFNEAVQYVNKKRKEYSEVPPEHGKVITEEEWM